MRLSGKIMNARMLGGSPSGFVPGTSNALRRWLFALLAGACAVTSFAASVTYEYDQLGRLRKAIYPDGTVIVYTLDPAGNRTSVATGIDTTAPTVPKNLAGTPTATPTVVLTWTASTDIGGVGIGGYRIFRDGVQIADNAGTATTFTDTNATGLIGSTTYQYTIAAYDLVKNASAQSSPISVTTPVVSESIPPAVPTGLKVIPTGMNTTTLTWNPTTDLGGSGLAGYKLYRNGSSTPISSPSATSFNDSGLTAGANYQYTVAGYDKAGNISAQSPPVALTMPTVPPGAISITTNNLTVTEGTNLFAAITLTRSGGTYTAASISCVGAAGTVADFPPFTPPATAVVDFSTGPVVVSWTAGDANPKTCNVPIVNDDVEEAGVNVTPFGNVPTYQEAFFVNLASPVGATAGTSSTIVVITDDDADPNDTTPPNAATGLIATNVTPTSVTLTWDPTRDTNGKLVPSYAAERCQGSACTTFGPLGPSMIPTITDTSVSSGQIWRYRVRGFDSAGNAGGYSNIVTVTIPTAPDTQKPTTPGSFAATALSSTSVRLSWAAATDNVGVTAYLIDRCTGVNCTTYAALATVGATPPLQFDDTGLNASTNYGYRIVARDAALNTSASPATTAVATQAPPDTQKPTVPANPSAAAAGATSIHLTWQAATDNVGVVGYTIERCVGSGCTGFTAINPTPVTTLSYDDTGLTGGTLYRYKIKARDAAGNLSDDVTTPIVSDTTTPNTPATITIPPSPNTTGSYLISWTIAGGSTGVTYELYQSKNDPLFGTPGLPYTTTGMNFSITGNTDGTYSYRVRACIGTRCSGYATGTTSVTVQIPDTSLPTKPPSPSAVTLGATSIRVTWGLSSDDRGVTSYRVQRCAGAGCVTFAEVTFTTGALTVDDNGLSPNVMYRYQIQARDAAGNNSPASDIVAATTYPDVPTSITVPTGTNTNGTYAVSWIIGYSTSGVVFELQESLNDSNFGAPVVYSTSSTSQTVTGRANGTYWYRVRACVGTTCSAYRTAASAVTVAVPDTSRPLPPGNPSAVGLDSTNVRISWTPASDNVGVTAYDVYRCTTSTCGASTNIGPHGRKCPDHQRRHPVRNQGLLSDIRARCCGQCQR
jgi:hypothetical protein